MAVKCGHPICPDHNCNLKFPFNGGARARCKRIQGCVSSHCSSLKALGPSGFVLYDACIGHCQDDGSAKYPPKYPSVNEYLCENFDPVALVEYFGVNPCAVDVDVTKIGQQNKAADDANRQMLIGLVAVGVVVTVLLIMLTKTNKK